MTTTAKRRWWPVLGAIAVSGGLVLTAAIVASRWSGGAPGHAAALEDPVAVALRTGKPTVVEFGSNWCQSCRDMKPVLATLDRDHGERLNLVDIDLLSSTGRRLIQKYRIQMMPTQVFFDGDGRELDRHLGPISGDDILLRLGLGPVTATEHP